MFAMSILQITTFAKKCGDIKKKLYFCPKSVLFKRTWQERKKNFLYWKRFALQM